MDNKISVTATATILFSLGSLASADTRTVEMKHFAPRVPMNSVPKVLHCENTAPSFLVALDLSMAEKGITVSKSSELWQTEAFGVFGYTLELPESPSDKKLARRTLELARHDNLVSAKIANDEAALQSSSYAKSVFHRDMQLYIRNNTTPDLPVDGELNAHELWLTKASKGVLKARTLMGNLNQNSGVRNYVLGAIYDDGIATAAAEKILCSKSDDKTVIGSALRIAKIVKTTKP